MSERLIKCGIGSTWLEILKPVSLCCNPSPGVHLLHPSTLLHLSSLYLQLHSSNMEALGGYPTKPPSSRARVLSLIITTFLCITSIYLLHAIISSNRKDADFYSFQVKDTKSRSVSLEKYRGKVSLTDQRSVLIYQHNTQYSVQWSSGIKAHSRAHIRTLQPRSQLAYI